MGNQEKQDQGILAFYSHTSRAFNSAITLTLAGMGFTITILTEFFTPLPILFRVLLASILYCGVIYGFIRIVELNVQLQFIESMIRINETTLLQFVNQRVPRFFATKIHRRFNQEQIQELQRNNWPFLRCLNFAHWVALVGWTLIFGFAMYALLFAN